MRATNKHSPEQSRDTHHAPQHPHRKYLELELRLQFSIGRHQQNISEVRQRRTLELGVQHRHEPHELSPLDGLYGDQVLH